MVLLQTNGFIAIVGSLLVRQSLFDRRLKRRQKIMENIFSVKKYFISGHNSHSGAVKVIDIATLYCSEQVVLVTTKDCYRDG